MHWGVFAISAAPTKITLKTPPPPPPPPQTLVRLVKELILMLLTKIN